MNKENIKNDPILYGVIKRNKTTKDNKDYNKERFDHLKISQKIASIRMKQRILKYEALKNCMERKH